MKNTMLLLSGAAMAWALPAAAQTADATAAAQASDTAEPDTSTLEDIVVTAQKRAENLQRVPIAITAVTATQLERASIENTSDLTFATPALNFSQTAVFAQPYIRGVGTDSFAPGNEASVATYIDGVYIASMSAGTFAFNNLERVEVLKGPQGTLYGRNSTGGLINVVTRTPTQEFVAKGSVGYGNFGTIEGQGYIAGGIGEGTALDLAVNVKHQDKGYYRNLTTGNRVSRDDGTYLRSKFVADLSDALTLTISGDWARFENTLANTRQPARNTLPALPAGSYTTIPGRYMNTRDDLGLVRDYGASVNLSGEFDPFNVVSITAWRQTRADQYLDGDDSGLPISDSLSVLSYRQFTQELQILSPDDAPFRWIVGGFYLKADAGWDPFDLFANNVRINRAFLFSASTSYAAFGQATFDIGANGELTVGGRYTRDEKDYRRSTVPGGDVKDSWNRPTWRLAYNHQLSDEVMAYASYNRGYKSGTYNTLLGPPVAVNPETVDSFETGLKSDLLENRLRVNVAGFYTKFRDIQVRSQQPGNVAVTLANAAAARIFGIDGDVYGVITPELQVQVGFSWINGKYTDFPGAELYVPRATGGNLLTIGSATGRRLPRTPEFSGNIGLTYDKRMANDSRVYGSVNLFLTDDILWDPSNRTVTKSYEVLNGTIGYALPGDHVSIEAWARNLTDSRYANYVVPSANADRTSYAPPRTYGVRVGFKF